MYPKPKNRSMLHIQPSALYQSHPTIQPSILRPHSCSQLAQSPRPDSFHAQCRSTHANAEALSRTCIAKVQLSVCQLRSDREKNNRYYSI